MSIEEAMPPETKQFKIVMPLEMKRWLAMEAAKNMRSQTAEVLLAVREKMDRVQNEKADATA